MCGIVGYVGYRQAMPILIDSLKRLEYRGYDSCGVALMDQNIQVYKDVGRIEWMEENLPHCSGCIGIGHTRWATHGGVTKANAHPHLDCSEKIAVVHNGIIENFQALRDKLTEQGHTFVSETDTEVIPHLVEKYYDGDLVKSVKRALQDIRGSYAFILMLRDDPRLIVVRKESPLVIGVGDGETFIASDVPALLEYTDRFIYLEDGDLAIINKEDIKISNDNGITERPIRSVSWNYMDAQKAGYEHYMLKEIHEQPRVIQDTLYNYLSLEGNEVDLKLKKTAPISNILFLSCGTSYHASLVGKSVIEKLTKIPSHVEIASEFNYVDMALVNPLVIGITQSGETADTLKALKKAKEMGFRTMSITNVEDSSAYRLTDENMLTKAGPEISVAATKSFVAQLVAVYLFALSISKMDNRSKDRMFGQLRSLPAKVQRILSREEEIGKLSAYLSRFENMFFVGRGINYATVLEGALKMKEVSYIHAEAYPAGELKHGTFALLTEDTPVVCIIARDNTYEPILSNIKEIKARGSPVIALAPEDDQDIEKYVDHVIRIPETDAIFSPLVNVVALQLLAYYTAAARDCPIDRPRNLAKSVTVE